MKIVRTIKALQEELQQWRAKGSSVGFVPTMGALHEGHIALVRQSIAENEVTAASIFINPAQFNNPVDLANYPRTEETDIKLLETNKCDIVFIPSVEEMYPDKQLLDINLGGLNTLMEGAFRPGHFIGVVTVVNKLFQIVKPGKAYFGEKDFQQLAIIKLMAEQLHPGIKIIGCPTIREEGGLAMSSRNILLNGEERAKAPVLYQSLLMAKELYRQNLPVKTIKQQVIERTEQSGIFKVQYFEIVHAKTLQPVEETIKDIDVQACIAVLTSKTRLIDNISLNV